MRDPAVRPSGLAQIADVAAPSAQAERVKAFFSQLGYRAYWTLAEKKYAGCALLVKRTCVQPALRFNLDEEGQGTPPEQHDKEGRVILASFGTFDFLGTYVPNQGSSEESFARRRGWDAKARSRGGVGRGGGGGGGGRPVQGRGADSCGFLTAD